jgi:biotin synthase
MNTVVATVPVSSLRHRAPIEPKVGRWSVVEVQALFAMPFMDLLFRAQQVHREHFDPSEVQLSTLLSIKTGGCAEDCGYCPQSSHLPWRAS